MQNTLAPLIQTVSSIDVSEQTEIDNQLLTYLTGTMSKSVFYFIILIVTVNFCVYFINNSCEPFGLSLPLKFVLIYLAQNWYYCIS
jgi:hypothetical protein